MECADPTDGFLRLEEQATARGLGATVEYVPQARNANSGLVVEDMDGDGDLDVVLGSFNGPPRVFANDGAGYFTEVPTADVSLQPLFDTAAAGYGVADLDGDGLLDLVQTGLGMVIWHRNLGGLVFEPPVAAFHDDSFPKNLYGTFTAGDLDGDGDLDLAVPGLEEYDSSSGGGMPGGSPDLVLRNDGGVFTELVRLTPDGRPGVNITGTFTDRDGDGDQDLLIPADLGQVITNLPPSAFYRNDGGELTNDAPEIGADLVMSAMGVTIGDYNGDDTLDYCMSDVGPVKCLISDGAGGYFEAGQAMGLIPDVDEVAQWSGWGIDLVDLDNDGLLDAAVAGGAPLGGAPENAVHSDHLFEGVSADPMRFEPRRGTDFDSEDNHYGLVAADLDGDGYLEVLVLGAPGPVKYWQNTCGVGRWLEVDLQGPTPNVKGIGARITVQSSNGREVREVQTVRAMMQSPARQHFGLGDAEQATVTVIWPDGAVSEGTVGTNRRITVVHPG